MDTATLSTKGQLVIPTRLRKALHLQPGDKVAFQLEGDRLIIKREVAPRPRLVMGEFGRPVLQAPEGAPPMTVDRIKAILNDDE
jgi:AbrB family looped-hinge helix DNA binding protein